MKRYLIREGTMAAIADAVRNKTGISEELAPADIAEKIATIRVHEGDPTMIGITITPTGNEIIKVPPNGADGFGIVTVEGDSNLVAENIKEGVSIYGVEGTLFEGVDTSDATAEACDILEGATAYVNGELIVGTHVCTADPILSPLIVTPTGTEFVETPEDGVDGFSEVTVEGDDNLVPENIVKGVTIYGVTGSASTSESGSDSGSDTDTDTDTPDTNYKLQVKDDIMPGVENVIVSPDSDYYGLKQVTVKGDTNLVAENIKEGVSIFGVDGTYANNKLPFVEDTMITLEGKELLVELIYEDTTDIIQT